MEHQFISLVSLSLNMLVLRMIKLLRPVGDLLQILGIIAQVGRLDVFHLIPQSTWRALWLGCRKCGGYLMRRVSNVIFEVLQIAGVELDAITAGQYVQAMTKTVSIIETDYSGTVIDSHLYLEEIGYLWYIHQMAILGVGGQREVISLSGSATKPLLTPERGIERKRSLRGLAKISFESPELVAASMQLSKRSGLFSLLSPMRPVYHAAVPLTLFGDAPELKIRYAELNERLEDILFEAGPREDKSSAPAAQSGVSDLQKKQSSWTWGWSSPKPTIATNLAEEFDIARGSVEAHDSDSKSALNLSKPSYDLLSLQHFIADCLDSVQDTKRMVTCISSRTPCPKCGCSLLDEETLFIWMERMRSDEVDAEKLVTYEDHIDLHRLVCEKCDTPYYPQLLVRHFAKDDSTSPSRSGVADHSDSNKSSDKYFGVFKARTLWSTNVPHLSPFSLFRLYELLVYFEGDNAIDKRWLCYHHPEIYWNLLWYGSRLGFPLALIEAQDIDLSILDPACGYTLVDGPVFVTWRELTAEQMAIRVLWNVGAPQVVLSDLLPQDSEDTIRRFVDIAGDLHDNVDGMKKGIIALYPEVESNKLLATIDDNPSRLVYTVLLTLYYLYYGQVLKERDAVVFEDIREVTCSL